MYKRLFILTIMLLGRTLCAQTFLPTGGAYSGPQTVSVAVPSGTTCFYTTDGSTPSIAGTPYTGPIPISTTTQIKVICAKIGVMVQNAGLTNARWKCTAAAAGTYGTVTCQKGGGVGSNLPSSLTWTFGTPMVETMSTTATSGETQALFINTTSSSTCTTCTELVEDKIVQVNKGPTFVANHEMDANANMLTTYNQFHTASLQCNQQSGTLQWQYDNQQGSWKNFPTPIKFGCPLSLTQQTEIRYGIHWTNGDTSCSDSTGSGYSKDTYDFLTVCVGGTNGTGGVCKDFPQTGLTLCGYHEPGFSQSVVVQDQHDMTNVGQCGANPCTANRQVWKDNVTLAFQGTSVTANASYTISSSAPPPVKLVGKSVIAGQVKRIQ
jgi:hypothetical protein